MWGAWEVLLEKKWFVLGVSLFVGLFMGLSAMYGYQEGYVAYVSPEVKTDYLSGTITAEDVYYEDELFFEEGLESLAIPSFGNELFDIWGDYAYSVMMIIFFFLALIFARKKKVKEVSYSLIGFLNMLLVGIIQIVLVVIGLVLFIIPGVYLYVRLYFAPYYALEYKSGPIKAFKQSMEATKGKFWKLFALVFLPFVIIAALVVIIFVLAVIVGLLLDPGVAEFIFNINFFVFSTLLTAVVLYSLQIAALAHVELDVAKKK